LGYWIIDQPRRLDRIKLAQLSLEVTKNCLFMGNNWKRYPEFAKFAASHTKNEVTLLRTYASSKINLHTNSHGFGLHSRVLEAMAVGGFIMTPSVADPTRTGRMCEYFEPDKHFGEFTPENFGDRARYWLENDGAREQAIAEAKKIIADKHLWKHRAAQVLGDLGVSP
jgi:glycosyltransferase involved in cell wall biosynthesis